MQGSPKVSSFTSCCVGHFTNGYVEIPNQEIFLSANAGKTLQETISKARKATRELVGPKKIDRILKENSVNIIIAPMDSQITTLGALSGKSNPKPKPKPFIDAI
jgi:hypothetical protein